MNMGLPARRQRKIVGPYEPKNALSTGAIASRVTSLNNIVLLNVMEDNIVVIFDFAELEKVQTRFWAFIEE